MNIINREDQTDEGARKKAIERVPERNVWEKRE